MNILILFGEGRVEFCESITLVKLSQCCKTLRVEFKSKLDERLEFSRRIEFVIRRGDGDIIHDFCRFKLSPSLFKPKFSSLKS